MNQMKRRMELILVKFKSPDVVPDILWPQLRRFSNRLQNILEETKYEFKVFGKSEYSNEKDLAVVLLEMEFSKLPTIQKRIGPKVFDIKDSERFLEKYKQAPTGPYVENNCWVVETPRKFLAARAKVQDVLKDSIKILKDKGIPNYIADEISKGYEIISENTSIIHLVKKDPTFGIFLRKYFDKESLS
jgi:tRNA nucleotidyltransferase (CCA-adding enzyme)